jgi:bacterioferritin (cytochrome b1)
MTPRDTEAQRSAEAAAISTLAALSDRLSRAAQSLTRMVMRMATEDDATKVVTSIAKYVNAGMPEAEAVADVAAVLEGAQSPEWRERRAKMRKRSQQQKLEWQLSTGRFEDAAIPNWGRATVLDAARRRRDVMAAAIAACEQREDSQEILEALAQHLAGRDSIHSLEVTLRGAGLSVEGSNVVPLIPRASSRG